MWAQCYLVGLPGASTPCPWLQRSYLYQGFLEPPPPLSTCMNMGEAVKVSQSDLLEATVPVARVGNTRTTEPWQCRLTVGGFPSAKHCFSFLLQLTTVGSGQLSSVRHIICQGFGKTASSREESRKGVSYPWTLVSWPLISSGHWARINKQKQEERQACVQKLNIFHHHSKLE